MDRIKLRGRIIKLREKRVIKPIKIKKRKKVKSEK